MDIKYLEHIARMCVDEEWGLGVNILSNPESAPPYYRFLHHVVNIFMPEAVLELGVYLGTATAHMALGNLDTLVIGVDTHFHDRALKIRSLFSNIRYIEANTLDPLTYNKVIDTLCEEMPIDDVSVRSIGLLFIDSEHNGITPWCEYMIYRNLFASECLVCCDDISDPNMRDFWNCLRGIKMEMNFLHMHQYDGYPDPGFGVCIVRR